MDSWQEEIYGLFTLFHSVRGGGFGPEPFSIGELEQTLHYRGYRDIEHIVDLLVAMDLTYRDWWHAENKKKDG